jgi:hypothetical protein
MLIWLKATPVESTPLVLAPTTKATNLSSLHAVTGILNTPLVSTAPVKEVTPAIVVGALGPPTNPPPPPPPLGGGALVVVVVVVVVVVGETNVVVVGAGGTVVLIIRLRTKFIAALLPVTMLTELVASW